MAQAAHEGKAHQGSLTLLGDGVTGASKGIGLALARAILAQHDDTFVFLGSRDEARGRAAADAVGSESSSQV